MKETLLHDKIAVVTGGYGAVCSAICKELAANGARTVIIGRNSDAAAALAGEIESIYGTISVGVAADVLDRKSIEKAKSFINDELGPVDILVNGAGGNSPNATTAREQMTGGPDEDFLDTFFGLDSEGFDKVFDLNFKGTLIPTMIFANDMVSRGTGSVINISSMNAFRPLTKIPAYSAAKAAVNNFTEWLAVHFAKTGVRVNAIAPGFIITDQNRFLLTNEKTGELTSRGMKVISNTPMGRFGTPAEMAGTVVYLASDMAKFVTGVVIPVDGGFNAYSGV